jgi:ClpP class serine protease
LVFFPTFSSAADDAEALAGLFPPATYIQDRERTGLAGILLVHRQETMSFLGFPVYKYITVDDSEEVIRAIHMTDKEMPIDLILHTPGGLVLASLQIAEAIKKHKGKVTVFVPHYAMSGGT